jgi:glutathione S-transferase
MYHLFSKVEQRAAPSSTKTKHIRLITIRVSHFCEKARWVLDMLDDDDESPYYYTEDCHPPGFHSFESVGASNDNGSATPMIVMLCNNGDGDDEVLYKSNIIIERLFPELYPKGRKDEIKTIEQDLGDRLGATVRCYAYDNLLCKEHYGALVTMATPDCSKVEHILFENMLPNGLAMGIRRSVGVNAESAALSKRVIVEFFDELSAKLEKADYLVGNQFTAADLSFAALACPLIRPPEMSNFQCSNDALPEDVLQLSQQLRNTKAGQHVLNMYAKHRFIGKRSKVVVKTANRNRFPLELGVLLVGCAAVVVGVGMKLVSR